PRTLLKVTGNVRTDYSSGGTHRLAAAEPRHQPPIPPASRGLRYSTTTRAYAGAMQDMCRWHGDLLTATRTVDGILIQDGQAAPVRPQPVPTHGRDACDECLHCGSPADQTTSSV